MIYSENKYLFQRIEAIVVRLIQVHANNIVFTLKIRLFYIKLL